MFLQLLILLLTLSKLFAVGSYYRIKADKKNNKLANPVYLQTITINLLI